MMQFTQVQLAQIASSAVNQALTQYAQQTATCPTTAATASTTAVIQQVQTPIKFDKPVFEGDSAGSWATLTQSVVYQARVCGFEAELTAAERERLNIGADVFDGSNVDPMRIQNTHVAWMTPINNCRGIAREIVQRSEAPNDARQNLQSHYGAKRTREIVRLSHEVNGKTLQTW